MLQSERPNQTANRVLQILVLVYQGIALLAFIGIPFLAIHWVQTPFLGAFVEQTMVFNGVGQDAPPQTWSLFQDKSLWLKYQLVNVNGVDVQNEAQVQTALADSRPGQTLPVVLAPPRRWPDRNPPRHTAIFSRLGQDRLFRNPLYCWPAFPGDQPVDFRAASHRSRLVVPLHYFRLRWPSPAPVSLICTPPTGCHYYGLCPWLTCRRGND